MSEYRADISPDAKQILLYWVNKCEEDHGPTLAVRLLDAFEEAIGLLEENPMIGTGNIKDIPNKYRATLLWKHLWLIYQINFDKRVVTIDYIIDERQSYGRLFE